MAGAAFSRSVDSAERSTSDEAPPARLARVEVDGGGENFLAGPQNTYVTSIHGLTILWQDYSYRVPPPPPCTMYETRMLKGETPRLPRHFSA
jgi:hypothetical protein